MLDYKPFDGKADVYSFGIVMWELAMQTRPWAKELKDVQSGERDEVLLGYIVQGKRPQLANAWPAEFIAVMCACWETSAATRPTMADVASLLSPATGGQRGRLRTAY